MDELVRRIIRYEARFRADGLLPPDGWVSTAAAYDYGRAVGLARWGLAARFCDPHQAEQAIVHTGALSRAAYGSWQDLSAGYALGRVLRFDDEEYGPYYEDTLAAHRTVSALGALRSWRLVGAMMVCRPARDWRRCHVRKAYASRLNRAWLRRRGIGCTIPGRGLRGRQPQEARLARRRPPAFDKDDDPRPSQGPLLDGTHPGGVLAREDIPAKERILALFDPPPTGTHPVRGCPFIDAAAEFPGPQNAVHSYAREQKLLMVRLVTDLVAELGCRQPRHGAGRGALRPVRADSGGDPCG
ncbi:DUF1266 domain-containing protein [Streptomyces sp. NPDC047097]|uniref:DUF1266 domain-containing protein n=1 Tax=Streptomyces sp. NPDC047097 TaxID=3155260 RepID=UPI0033F410F8